MKIHEYQAKELLAAAGANVPRHVVVRTPEEAEKAFDQLSGGGWVVVKAQVHAGGRGQGELLGSGLPAGKEKGGLGGVKPVGKREDARRVAELMLKHPLRTKQTGPEGTKVHTLIVQADAKPAKEFYLGMVLDRAGGLPVMMASAEGGMDIEEVAALRDLNEENPAEVRAGKANLSYIQLDGTIGCLVNGAGLAMATMDVVKHHGGNPANFLDVGGSVTAENAVEAFRIILSDPKVRAIFVNVFGGIASCATVANALVKAGREVGFKVPVVVRLEGNEVDKAREILAAVKDELPTIRTAPDLTAAARLVVELAK